MTRDLGLPPFLYGRARKDDHKDKHHGRDNDKRGDAVRNDAEGAGGPEGDLQEAVIEEQDGDFGDGDVAAVDNLADDKDLVKAAELCGGQVYFVVAHIIDAHFDEDDGESAEIPKLEPAQIVQHMMWAHEMYA